MSSTMRAALFLLALMAQLAFATEYEISADRMRMVDGNFSFDGNVLVTGTNLRLEASQILVEGNEYKASGKPAQMSYVHNEVETNITSDSIFFSEKASMVELAEGGLIEREGLRVTAGEIRYLLESRLLEAGGGVEFDDGEISAIGDSAVSSSGGGSLLLRLKGRPAQIEVPGNQEHPLQATATDVEYDENRGLIRLQGNVHANLGRENLTGDVVVYDIKRGSFTAESTENGRVQATIQTQ